MSLISLQVRIWKIRHSSPGCCFVWTLRVVYFPLKHSCLYNKKKRLWLVQLLLRLGSDGVYFLEELGGGPFLLSLQIPSISLHLKSKGTHFFEPFHCVISNLFHLIILQWVIALLKDSKVRNKLTVESSHNMVSPLTLDSAVLKLHLGTVAACTYNIRHIHVCAEIHKV